MKMTLSLLLTAAVTVGSVATAVGALHQKGERADRIENVLNAGDVTGTANDPKVKPTAQTRAAYSVAKLPTEVKMPSRVAPATKGVMRVVDADLDIQGTVTASDAWSGDYLYGFYSIPKSDDEPMEQLVKHKGGYLSGYFADGYFYGAWMVDAGWLKAYYVDKYDTETWERLSITQTSKTLLGVDIAVDPISGLAYGCFPNTSDGYDWAICDFEALSRQTIVTLDQKLEGVAVDKNGQFYAVGADAAFYKLDKATGDLTKIGDTGLNLKYQTGACYNDRNGNVLMSYCNDNEAGLAEIDITTGAATIVATYPDNEQVNCLTIVKADAEAGAPAAPDLEVSCFEGAMAVDVKLTMPATFFDGTDATGETFDYTVLAGNAEIMTGSAAAGAVVEKNVPLTISGDITFVAVAMNADGPSPRTKAACFIGTGSPKAPENVVLAWSDGTAVLSWDAVTEATDNGYLNPADVTYTIVDAQGETVAEGVTGTSYSFDYPAPELFISVQYGVQAVYGGKPSVVTLSNKVELGNFTAPLTMDMTNQDSYDLHTVLDANGDGKTWKFYSSFYSAVTQYPYSADNDADDWLFSPSVQLEGGKAYMLTATVAAGSNSYPERLAVAYGQGKTAEAMTSVLIPATVLTSTDKVVLSGAIKPAESGLYTIGFHAISDADCMNLNLYEYSIGEAMDGNTLDAVQDLTVTRDADGAFKATIACKAPATNVVGDALSGSLSVKIERDGTLLTTVAATPGSEVSYVDEVPRTGTYNYTVAAVGEDGTEGIPTSVKVFVGATKPVKVQNLSMRQSAPGQYELTWTPVTEDVNGDPISSANVTYDLYTTVEDWMGDLEADELLAYGITGDTYTYVTDAMKGQSFLSLALVPVNRDVEGDAAVVTALVGEPYDLPVIYTGSGSEYFISYSGSGTVTIRNRESLCEAQDGDDSYYVVEHYNLGVTTLETGLIDLSVSSPAVKFFIYKTDEPDANTTEVYVVEGDQATKVGGIVNNDFEGTGWFPVVFDLSAFKDKVVRIRFEVCTHPFDTVTNQGRKFSIFDNIRITNNLEYDLHAEIDAPEQVETGAAFNIDVIVTNDGSKDAAAYTVEFLRDGEVIDSQDFDGLEVFGKNVLSFGQLLTIHDGDKAVYTAKVNFAADLDTDNNEARADVKRKPSLLPPVTGLAGEHIEGHNSLTWDAFMSGQISVVETTESFENAEFGDMEVEGWIFIDGDQGSTASCEYTMNNKIPGFLPGDKMAFLVIDGSQLNINCHSGTKCIVDIYREDDGLMDDWAISPELSGDAQTISFFARSASSSYPEKIEVWYSTSGTELDDFVQVESFDSKQPGTEWTKYMVALPAGAKHFAIHSCARGSMMLLLDDFTYAKLEVFDGEHLGYNVYCDSEALNEEPVAENAYLHSDGEPHTYHVTAVYDKGESELSEAVTIGVSGINDITFGNLKVAVEGKTIVVTGAADGELVNIYSIDGRTLYSAAGDARVEVASAIYLVTVGKITVKVVVR